MGQVGKRHAGKGREEADFIEIYGRQPVREAFLGGWPVSELLLRGEPGDEMTRTLERLAQDARAKVTRMEPPAFDRRFRRTTQGVVATVKNVSFGDPDAIKNHIPPGRKPLFLALDGIEDPQNLGAITRTAFAMAVDAVVIPRRRSAALGEGAAKASAGAIFRQPICQVPNIHHFTQWAKDSGLWVYGLDAGGSHVLWDVDLTGPVALIVGGEGKGLSRLARERCDFLVRIPMAGTIGSLNASVSCAIAVAEVCRQRAGQT